MKTMLIAILMVSAPSAFAAGVRCAKVEYGETLKIMSWRSAPTGKEATKYMSKTRPNQSGEYSVTDRAREKEMKDAAVEIVDYVWKNDQAAMSMSAFPEVKSTMDYIEGSGGDYGSGKSPAYTVSKIRADGKLRATMLLPVSGREGNATTKKWAENDTITVYIEVNGQRTDLINAKSLDIVTIQEIEIPLIKGQVVKLLYTRSGSAGPYGFPEGRIMDLTWDGTFQ